MIRNILTVVLLSTTIVASAQLAEGKKNIENLCGCFDVTFKYAETFSPNKSYKFHDRESLRGIELVLPVEVSDKKFVLQHLLLVDSDMVIKHWREDWIYEAPELFVFQGNKQWTKQTLLLQDYKNKWTQSVWEVDDAPRYQGIGEWISNKDKTYWESIADAPLPRREYTVRNDYNILKRDNRIVVIGDSWRHEQDNQKIRRTAGNDTLIAEEKGINTYNRIADSKCEKAKEWWQKNGAFWNQVRAEWENYFKTANSVSLKSKINEKRLHEYFSELWKQWSTKAISTEEVKDKLREVIASFRS